MSSLPPEEVWLVRVSAAPFCSENGESGLGFDFDLNLNESDEALQRLGVSRWNRHEGLIREIGSRYLLIEPLVALMEDREAIIDSI